MAAVAKQYSARRTARNTGVIFRRMLRDSRWGIVGWGVAMAVYAAYLVVFYPTIEGIEIFNELMENPLMQAFMGGFVDIASPGGFLGAMFFLFAPLFLGVYGVLHGLGFVAAEEDNGTLDILLAMPIPRWQVIIEKFLAMTLMLLLILAINTAGFMLSITTVPQLQEITLEALLPAMINLVPVVLFLAALTLFLSTILRSREAAGGLAGGFIIVSYFLNSFLSLADAPLSNLRYLSFFSHYGGVSVLTEGIPWGGFALISALTVLFLAASLWTFTRRDLS